MKKIIPFLIILSAVLSVVRYQRKMEDKVVDNDIYVYPAVSLLLENDHPFAFRLFSIFIAS